MEPEISFQPKEQPRLLQQLSRFYLLPFPRKKLGYLRIWTSHVHIVRWCTVHITLQFTTLLEAITSSTRLDIAHIHPLPDCRFLYIFCASSVAPHAGHQCLQIPLLWVLNFHTHPIFTMPFLSYILICTIQCIFLLNKSVSDSFIHFKASRITSY